LAKRRIYELAKDYKISSDALLAILRELGFDIKSHMSVVDSKMQAAVEEKFQKEKEAVKKEYALKKERLEQRKEAEESKEKIQEKELKLKRKEELRELEKKKLEIKRKKPKPASQKKVIDQKEIEESVKKTLTEIEAAKGVKRYKKKEKDDLIEEVVPSNLIRTSEYISVAELANLIGVKPTEVITKCMQMGVMASINQRLDMDTIQAVALEFGFNVEPVKEVGVEEEEEAEGEEELEPRAPVITIMGHVDHGKTSLLDYIRKSKIIAGEYGGITQHIGAYTVKLPAGNIIFLDTPGHEAFTAMRARGAQITDIVVLVVAVDDSVMPQTVEAIDHARAAGVPIIVAINKMDLPAANSEPVKQQLAKYNLVPEEWGGSTIVVEMSAKTGKGVDKLLEMILLQAEMMELKANPYRRAQGVVIESELDRGKGVVVTVLVEKGSLKVGDPFLAGRYYGKVRAMLDERGNKVYEARPSSPVLVLGCSGIPQAGDGFQVTRDEQEAREIGGKRLRLRREQDLRQAQKIVSSQTKEGEKEEKINDLRLIIKGDVDGSVEALSDTLERISAKDVKLNVIHKGVGSINESDVLLAVASGAMIIGFHTRPDIRARELAARHKVDIRLYNIIYEVESDVKKALEGLLLPEIKEEITATIQVREIFRVPKIGQVAGCYVQEGKVKRTDKVRVIRDGVSIYDAPIFSLKRFKDDVREVESGFECGIKIENYNDLKVGDIIEVYQTTESARKLEEI
jgi:translation initiation factor IF-2